MRLRMFNPEGVVNAPDFPEDAEWLNTDRPLSISQLRGKIVLLDFWTFCCINCMHILPDLKRLEHKYSDELVVIGVHSAKFAAEQETENIRQAVLRYEIEHPVINDHSMQIWQEYTARAWPTIYLINPLGKVVAYMSGEGVYDQMDGPIQQLIDYFDARSLIDRRPLNLRREPHAFSILAFPGKVLADETTETLFISDSNHNRIVVVSLDDSSVQEVIGSGRQGFDDGDFAAASFNHPQGMALDMSTLYVADTENHAIRAVDLRKRSVTTIAGTGRQATRLTTFGGQGNQTDLNSPWDLTVHQGLLYIAMAGPHQLWQMNPKTGGIAPFAGTGREARIDGPLAEAALAQPSGITTDGTKLYFADSEVSSIRSADLDPHGRVETIVGEGLFDFGDRDGTGLQVRLQHPLGIVYNDGLLYVADTYNNKIKIISPEVRSSTTFAGTGERGNRDGDRASFDEPGGLSIAGGKLYVADTNNHLIRTVDLRTRTVETLEIKLSERVRPSVAGQLSGEVIDLPAKTIEPGDGSFQLHLELPSGYKLNSDAPSAVNMSSSSDAVVRFLIEQPIKKLRFPVIIPFNANQGESTITADLVIYYCEAEKNALCYFKETRLRLDVKVERDAGSRVISANYELRHQS